jgi:aryl carrier-like protein
MTDHQAQPDAEATVLRIWQDLLGTEVAADDDFFEVGGDSLLVVDFLLEARKAGLELRSSDVFEHPTAAGLAGLLATANGRPDGVEPAAFPAMYVSADEIWRTHLSPWDEAAPRCLVPLSPGEGEPLYVVHWGNGAVRFVCEVAESWGGGRPVYGFEAPGYRESVRPLITIADMAERYLGELLSFQPEGPYFLTGVCQGAVVAFEMARRLRERAEAVTLLLLKPSTLEPWMPYGWGLDDVFRFRVSSLPEWLSLTGREGLPEVFARMRSMGWYDDQIRPVELPRLQMVWAALAFSLHHYEPRPYTGRVVAFSDRKDADGLARNWRAVTGLETVWFSYGVESALPILRDPLVAEVMRRELGRSPVPGHAAAPRGTLG